MRLWSHCGRHPPRRCSMSLFLHIHHCKIVCPWPTCQMRHAWAIVFLGKAVLTKPVLSLVPTVDNIDKWSPPFLELSYSIHLVPYVFSFSYFWATQMKWPPLQGEEITTNPPKRLGQRTKEKKTDQDQEQNMSLCAFFFLQLMVFNFFPKKRKEKEIFWIS